MASSTPQMHFCLCLLRVLNSRKHINFWLTASCKLWFIHLFYLLVSGGGTDWLWPRKRWPSCSTTRANCDPDRMGGGGREDKMFSALQLSRYRRSAGFDAFVPLVPSLASLFLTSWMCCSIRPAVSRIDVVPVLQQSTNQQRPNTPNAQNRGIPTESQVIK